jgi:hypothetical protein
MVEKVEKMEEVVMVDERSASHIPRRMATACSFDLRSDTTAGVLGTHPVPARP